MTAYVFDGQKSIALEQFAPQAWTNLSPNATNGPNDSRADRDAVQGYYETVACLFRCVEIRQVGISRVPWAIVRNGKDVWVDSEPKPPKELDYLKGFRRLLRLTEAALCLSPEAFWFVEQNRARPLMLRWFAPSSVIPQWSESEGLTGFKRMLGQGKTKIFEPQDIVYFALPNPFHETIPGRPPAQAAMSAAGVLYNVDAFASSFFERGAIKATLLTAPATTPPAERERLKSWWRRAFMGIGSAFGAEVVTTDVVPVTVGEGIEGLGNTTLTEEKKTEIATALGVPHSLVASNAANFATAQQDDLHFYDKTVIPSFSVIAETLNEQLLERFGYSMELRPEAMSIFQEDEQERSQSVQHLSSAGVSVDLAMEILGYDLTDEQWARLRQQLEDKPVVPVAAVPMPSPAVDVAANTPEQDRKAAEIATLRRWAAKRVAPKADDFKSDILTVEEIAVALAEVSRDTNFFPLAKATDGKNTRKNFIDDDGELEKRLEQERKAQRAIARGLKTQRERLIGSLPDSGGDFARWAQQDLEDALTRGMSEAALRRALIQSVDLGVSVAVSQFDSIGFGFDWTLANNDARKWAEQHVGQLIRDIDATTLERTRRAVAAWVDNGEPLSRLVEELIPVFGAGRAELIASTEVTRAYAEGNRQAYHASGVVTRWIWRTSEDERVCPICGPLADATVKIDGDFSGFLPDNVRRGTITMPPAHPRCRCFLSPYLP